MRLRWRVSSLIATWVLVAVTVAALLRQPLSPATESGARPGLQVHPESLHFGSVAATEKFVWKFGIENTSHSEIEIARFRISCGCTKIDPPRIAIPPGRTREVTAHLNLLPIGSNDAKSPVRDFGVQIIPIVNAAAIHQGWTIRGKVRQRYALSATSLEFGEILVDDAGAEQRDLHISFEEAILSLTPRYDSRHLDIITRRGDANRFQILVGLKDATNAPLGPFEEDFTLSAKMTNGEQLSVGPIKVLGQFGYDIGVQPDVVHFGPLSIGESAEQIVVLRSRKDSPFEFINIVSEWPTAAVPLGRLGPEVNGRGRGLDGVHVKPPLGDWRHAMQFLVTQRANRLGEIATSVRFIVRDKQTGKEYAVELKVMYYGIKP